MLVTAALGWQFAGVKVDLEMETMTPEELLRVWEPQAKLVAAKAHDGDQVLRFLLSKGVPESVAGERAAELWVEAQKDRRWWTQPRCWVGGGMMGFGLALAGLSFLFGVGVLAAIAACGFCGLGAAVMWGGFLERS